MIDEKKLIEDLKGTSLLNDILIKIVESQPKIGEWIPCSERLPESGQRYLVSGIWKDKDYEVRRTYDAAYGSDGVWHTHNYEPVNYEVIAWQPLPEPYKP